MAKIIGFVGRLCISAIFIVSGVGQIVSWRSTQREIITVFTDWLVRGFGSWAEAPIEVAIDWSLTVLIAGIVLQLLGGALLIFGIKVRFGALCLLVFTALATVMFHNFWAFEGPARTYEVIMFLKNLSIIGGLLVVIAFGTGLRKVKT